MSCNEALGEILHGVYPELRMTSQRNCVATLLSNQVFFP